MTDAERLANIRECYGPDAFRVGDPPCAADVELLLRLLDDAERRLRPHADTHDLDE